MADKYVLKARFLDSEDANEFASVSPFSTEVRRVHSFDYETPGGAATAYAYIATVTVYAYADALLDIAQSAISAASFRGEVIRCFAMDASGNVIR